MIIRLDSDGNELWQLYDEESSPGSELRGITETPDGGFVGVGDNPSQSGAYILVRTDYFGEVLWRVQWRPRGNDADQGVAIGGWCYKALPMENGGYLMAGLDIEGGLDGITLIGTEPDPVEIDFELELMRDSLDFGELKIDSTSLMVVPFTNIGRRYVIIDSLWFDGDSVFTSPLELPFRIDPLDTMYVPVTFSPVDDTTLFATLYLSYGYEQTLEVTLVGKGETPNAVRPDIEDTPHEFEFTDIYPNPFNNSVHIGFSLPEDSDIRLSVYNLNGRLIQSLSRGKFIAGRYTESWNAEISPSGIYIVGLESSKYHQSRKVTLLK